MPLPPTPYPRAWIEFDGQPVPNDAVRSLSLETNVTFQADSLELLLDNGPRYSDFIAKERAVNCWLGYVAHPVSWHKDELVHVFSGGVDGVLPTWGADMTLTVRCRDHTRRLIDSQGDPAWAWTAMTDAEVVAKLAARAGLQADIAPATGHLSESEWTSLTGLDAYGLPPVAPSGWDIVQQLAIRNGYVAVVTVDGRLYFGPRGGVGTVPILGSAVGAAIATAILGTWTYFAAPFDLLAVSFDDSALVVNKVTVARWLGEDAGGYAGGSAVDDARLKAARGRVIERTIVSTTAADEAACKVEATARLAELTRAAITATATVEGDPRLVGDVRVRLAGEHLGRFANDYYVLAATHRYGTDGYTTDLQLSSERPEASEVYRPSLSTEGALTPEQTEAGAVPTCGEAPIDYAAEWPEYGGPLERLLDQNGLPAGAAHATCGPIAAAGMLKAYGIATDPGKLAARAYQGDGPQDRWWTGAGMAGPDSEVKLLVAAGLKATNLGTDTAEAIKRTSACQPVIFDTPNHYLLASAYRADGRFFVGVTGSNALHGGSDWMSLAEIAANGGTAGAVRAVIVADVMTAGANQAVVTPAAYPLTAVPAGLIHSAPARLQAAITKRWPAAEWDNAAAISFNETGGSWNETAHKDDAIEDSRGVFQVNVRPNANPQYAGWNLLDYDRCAEAAYAIWQGAGNSWRRWTTAAGLHLA